MTGLNLSSITFTVDCE